MIRPSATISAAARRCARVHPLKPAAVAKQLRRSGVASVPSARLAETGNGALACTLMGMGEEDLRALFRGGRAAAPAPAAPCPTCGCARGAGSRFKSKN